VRQILDADVLIGALDRSDAHHARARKLLTECRDRQDAVSISVVNLSEALIAPSADPAHLSAAREAIARGIAVV
jgi:predicted nucleic acid-binding protein